MTDWEVFTRADDPWDWDDLDETHVQAGVTPDGLPLFVPLHGPADDEQPPDGGFFPWVTVNRGGLNYAVYRQPDQEREDAEEAALRAEWAAEHAQHDLRWQERLAETLREVGVTGTPYRTRGRTGL